MCRERSVVVYSHQLEDPDDGLHGHAIALEDAFLELFLPAAWSE